MQIQSFWLFELSLISVPYFLGQSIIEETIFENRLRHVDELNRMGASISTSQSEIGLARIEGVSELRGQEALTPTDLRAGACLVLAALGATGTSSLIELQHISRGYSKMFQKLQEVGADIVEEDCSDPISGSSNRIV